MIFKNEEYLEIANNIKRVVVHVSHDRQIAALANDQHIQYPSSAGKPERFSFSVINQNLASGKWIKNSNYQFPAHIKILWPPDLGQRVKIEPQQRRGNDEAQDI
jgi:hypothetical protein